MQESKFTNREIQLMFNGVNDKIDTLDSKISDLTDMTTQQFSAVRSDILALTQQGNSYSKAFESHLDDHKLQKAVFDAKMEVYKNVFVAVWTIIAALATMIGAIIYSLIQAGRFFGI